MGVVFDIIHLQRKGHSMDREELRKVKEEAERSLSNMPEWKNSEIAHFKNELAKAQEASQEAHRNILPVPIYFALYPR